MYCVNDFSEIEDGIKEIKNSRKGFLTNFFPDRERVSLWIKQQILYKIHLGESIFFLKRNTDFDSIYFITTGNDTLSASLKLLVESDPLKTFIADLVGKENVLETKMVFESSSFHEYTYLVRMNRMVHDPGLSYEKPENLQEANPDQANEIMDLFSTYFDPKAEQLPLKEEIIKWINLGTLLIYQTDNKIVGFIIYDLNGGTLYLRYWFVHPEFREQKIGSHLFNYFLFKGKDSKRQIFWVINSNDNAIKRYKHYGFLKENMYNYVMTNKKLRYEG